MLYTREGNTLSIRARDVQDLRHRPGIIEEKLVEVTHPEGQDVVLVILAAEMLPLGHHGGALVHGHGRCTGTTSGYDEEVITTIINSGIRETRGEGKK